MNKTNIHHMQLQQTFGSLSLDVSADFNNDMIVISGENGAGKTTLLRCLAGLERVTGRLHIHNKTWLDSSNNISLPTAARNIAFMWSEAVLLPWLSVADNIQLGVVHHAVFFEKICSACHIKHLCDREPAMLSTGEAQRVALARALYRKPCMLLLDEPFSAQAPDVRNRLRFFLQDLQQAWSIPVFLVSHDNEDAKVLAHQHWHMLEGRIV